MHLEPAVVRRRRIRGAIDRGVVAIRRDNGAVLPRLVNLHRLAVERRIGKVIGRAAIVHQCEVELAGVLVDAGAASEDLLELGHGAHDAVEHDQPAGLHIDAGGEQTRGGDQHGISGFRVDEVAQLRLALGVAAGDAHDVARVPLHQVGILVDERLSHAARVFPVDAEDDRFLEAVAAFFQEFRDLPGHQLGAFVKNQRAVEVAGVVDAVLDLVAVAVELPLLGTVALHVAIDMDSDDLVGGQEAILDALLQGIGVDGLAKVVDVGNVVGFPGRGGHTDLRGRREILQNLPPGGIFRGAAAMALVDHDEIEEAARELAKNLLVLFRPP